MTAIEKLAGFISDPHRKTHPPAAIARAKYAFLDTIACMYIGTDSLATRSALTSALVWGEGASKVYGTQKSLPAPWAAMVNGASAHALDLDDYTLQANDHASAVLVPAILAAADRPGAAFSGMDLLDAYLIGLEVIFRLGEAVNMGHYKLGWHTTSTLDSLGATAAVCRLWNLQPSETATALSLTTSLGSGYVSQFGTSGKPLHAGFSAKNGLVAAGLGHAGATAYRGALDGDVSFRTLLVPKGEARFEQALAKLGAPWGIEEFGLGAKIYPSCGYTHRTIDCAIALHRKLGIQAAEEIESAEACLPDFHLAILPFHLPKDRTEALFSTAYCVARGLATGQNQLADFVGEAVQCKDIRALCERITVKARIPERPEINVDPDDPDRVTVNLRDGRQETVFMGRWTGAPGKELTDGQFNAKISDCLELSGKLSGEKAQQILETGLRLDQLSSDRMFLNMLPS
jgi:2-methylcitrate dehydratase PrpD